MLLINRITDNAIQRIFLTGLEGERIQMTLRYMPTQEAWYADFLRGDFDLKGVRIVNSINLLRQYKNIIDFGILCDTTNGLDPIRPDDFLTQNAKLNLLDASEVQAIEEAFFK